MIGRRRRDDGNLMLLAGIVVTIAFVTTALTLSQVAALERQAVSEAPTPLGAEWRFLRDRLASNLNTSVTPDMRASTFNESTLPAIAATFRSIEAEKGYDVVLRLATLPTLYNKTEADLTSGGNYAAWTVTGNAYVDWAKDGDATDGMLWKATCDDASAPATGCISAILLYVALRDGSASVEEVMLFRVNMG